jgi:hypothetical protein
MASAVMDPLDPPKQLTLVTDELHTQLNGIGSVTA